MSSKTQAQFPRHSRPSGLLSDRSNVEPKLHAVNIRNESIKLDEDLNQLKGRNNSDFRDSLAVSEVEVTQTQLNEPLIGGLAWLRAVQLLNFDIYYIHFSIKSREATKLYRSGDVETAANIQKDAVYFAIDGGDEARQVYYSTILDTLAKSNPLQKYIDKYEILDKFCRFLKIFLSLTAIVICFDRTLANIILCLVTRNSMNPDENSTNSNMGLIALISVNASSLYILYSTIFNGHLIWNLFSRRLFLVSRRFQVKTMIMLLPFIYLEYLINIVFVDNLYEWEYTSNSMSSGKFSVLANLRILATEKDEDDNLIDTFMTIIQFVRGIIRISPYIMVNYAIVCLGEHINLVRNQHLLTESLKKRTKLRLAVRRGKGNTKNGKSTTGKSKKKVNFDKKSIGGSHMTGSNNTTNLDSLEVSSANRSQRKSVVNLDVDQLSSLQVQTKFQQHPNRAQANSENISNDLIEYHNPNTACVVSLTTSSDYEGTNRDMDTSDRLTFVSPIIEGSVGNIGDIEGLDRAESRKIYLNRIRDFDELESYITNLYIFTGRLNRFMTRQGLSVFYIVHNFLISASVIRPEAIHGGPVMIYLIQSLMVVLAFVPFMFGESLNGQLEQLSKQIDRIIIQQQLTHNRRDNLVRIRELIHDIRVNCGGMLNFNVEDGIKFLVIAFASAFFIEQERKCIHLLILEPTPSGSSTEGSIGCICCIIL